MIILTTQHHRTIPFHPVAKPTQYTRVLAGNGISATATYKAVVAAIGARHYAVIATIKKHDNWFNRYLCNIQKNHNVFKAAI